MKLNFDKEVNKIDKLFVFMDISIKIIISGIICGLIYNFKTEYEYIKIAMISIILLFLIIDIILVVLKIRKLKKKNSSKD